MTIPGTVVNGVIVLEGSAHLPEGARVWVELDEEDCAEPLEPYDREKELAILREAVAEAKAGKGMPFDEFMAQVARDYNLPPVRPKS